MSVDRWFESSQRNALLATMNIMTIVYACVLLAFLFEEPGHAEIATAIDHGATMSSINLAEVLGRFARDGHDIGAVRSHLERSSIEWVPFDNEQALAAAALLPRTLHLELSLGDRACLALATLRALPALTADRAWLEVDLGVDV